MKKFYLCILCVLSLISCNNKTETELEKKLKSGVVLISNTGHYELTLSNGVKFYFSTYTDEDGLVDFTMNKDSIHELTSYGTGFFISEKGEIVTNQHVTSGCTDFDNVNDLKNCVLSFVKDKVNDKVEEYGGQVAEMEETVSRAFYNDEVGVGDYQSLKERRDKYVELHNRYKEIYEAMNDTDMETSTLEYRNRLGIAYYNAIITDENGFEECVMSKSDVEHDLAVIQLKNKKTPKNTYVFTVPDEDPLENYGLMDQFTTIVSRDKNSKLCMLSYNLGPILFMTEDGNKYQFHTGEISQKTGGRIMYSIPALPGSSGSPVFNLKGELVAINYGGLESTRSFNYGIRVGNLRKLINN